MEKKIFSGYFICPVCNQVKEIPWLITEEQDVVIQFTPSGIKKMKFECDCGARWEVGIMEQNELEEQRKIKWVVRHGKKVRKIECPPGYKVVDGQCRRMTAQERIKRKKAAKKRLRKIRPKLRLILRKRRFSLKKRKTLGLDKRK